MKNDDKKKLDTANEYEETDQTINYYDDEAEAYVDRETVQLTKLKQKELPCSAEYREPTEAPGLRESIGFDFSWIHSSASRVQSIKCGYILALLISFIASIITNFC